MTASRCRICSATTKSTTRPISKTIATAANENHSTNCGHEGPTDDPTIHQRFAASCEEETSLHVSCLRRGVPPGYWPATKVANSQSGNNNAYLPKDNETGWINWDGLHREGDDLNRFVGPDDRGYESAFPQLRSRRWLDGRRADGSYGVLWADTSGPKEMKEAGTGNFPEGRFLALCASGRSSPGKAADFSLCSIAAPEAIAVSNCRKTARIQEAGSQLLNTRGRLVKRLPREL